MRKDEWQKLINQLLQQIYQVVDLTLQVVSEVAPEGYNSAAIDSTGSRWVFNPDESACFMLWHVRGCFMVRVHRWPGEALVGRLNANL